MTQGAACPTRRLFGIVGLMVLCIAVGQGWLYIAAYNELVQMPNSWRAAFLASQFLSGMVLGICFYYFMSYKLPHLQSNKYLYLFIAAFNFGILSIQLPHLYMMKTGSVAVRQAYERLERENQEDLLRINLQLDLAKAGFFPIQCPFTFGISPEILERRVCFGSQLTGNVWAKVNGQLRPIGHAPAWKMTPVAPQSDFRIGHDTLTLRAATLNKPAARYQVEYGERDPALGSWDGLRRTVSGQKGQREGWLRLEAFHRYLILTPEVQ